MHSERPSLTASLVAAIRALYTEMPPPYRIAPDPFAATLLPPWLALPAKVAGLVPSAAPAVHALGRVVAFGLVEHVALRTRAIDDALRSALARTDIGPAPHRPSQLVILGAGLDSRALRIPELSVATTFEVDHPNTHRYKAFRLTKLAPATRPAIHVPIDFERERLADVLPAAGFDAAKPTFWIWEGVTVYLTRPALETTVGALGKLSAPHSRVAVTYSRPGNHRGQLPERLFPLLGRLVGEPVPGMITTEALVALFEAANFAPISDESASDWAARYWPTLSGAREWERLLILEKGASERG